MSSYSNAPFFFSVCTVREGECPLRETCLRSRVFVETRMNTSDKVLNLCMVNHFNPQSDTCTQQCQMYCPDQKKRMAKGMVHLYDNVPKRLYSSLRSAVMCVFNNRTFYYESRKGKRLISEEEQRRIQLVFQRYGISEPPQFDSYVDDYDWSDYKY